MVDCSRFVLGSDLFRFVATVAVSDFAMDRRFGRFRSTSVQIRNYQIA